jgi:DNA-binding transcriptional MocR family regulator
LQAEQPYAGFPTYYAWLCAEYRRKRGILMQGLASAGLKPVAPQGGFFIIADTSNVAVPEKCVARASSEGHGRWGLAC